MDAEVFDEDEFFAAIAGSGTRALLIGRQALIALGLPLQTDDYDFWIHIDDIEKLNAAVERLELFPNHTPDGARGRGRYVLEGDERVDVLVARVVPTVAGDRIAFEDLWPRRRTLHLPTGATIQVPNIDDLIATKRFAARPKDAEDIRLLEVLRSKPLP